MAVLKIQRLASTTPVHEAAQTFINKLRTNPAYRSEQRFNSVQFVTTSVPDPKARDTTSLIVMYEAYVTYYEGS